MIYLRRIFPQDLKKGKQIAFTKEPSNLFFGFNYNNNDPERQISFTHISNSGDIIEKINTRLYAASSESRIDSPLKSYLIDNLNVTVNDLLIFSRVNLNNFKFQYVSQSDSNFEVINQLLNSNNHELISTDNNEISESDFSPKNVIYYGAPGTGKSYKVDNIINGLESKYFERLTFHPEFDNVSFVGGYKPISEEDSKGIDTIKYKFVPQAFTNIYERAWKDDKSQYYLVIEEINRGNCAEIFGEIFQLLDRTSKYTISPSKELREHLEIAFDDKNHEGVKDGLKLPNNLNIYATMNTSDQSLFPMDSAFKRRWEWEYVPICYTQIDDEGNPNSSFDFIIDIQNGEKYSWIKFIEQINLNHIKINPSLGMDKCIGNYFIKPDDELTISLKPFINKVVFYLWNDVFKDEENKVFEDNTSYEDFFPIETKGKSKIEELFNRIDLKPIAKEYTLDNESQIIQKAAEGPVQYGDEVS
jgi:5-methylcytosine-specific restriction endonuclease McrBC GTP-binding regulatory subunit McrB